MPIVWARWDDHPPDAILVDRTTIFGNPFRGERAVEQFVVWVFSPAQEPLRARAREILRGHDLVCWCGQNKPCHARVWLEIANSDE